MMTLLRILPVPFRAAGEQLELLDIGGQREDRRIRDDHIVALARRLDQLVGSVLDNIEVVALAADEDVDAGPAEQAVVVIAAQQGVVVGTAFEHVVAGAAIQLVLAEIVG